MPDFHETGYGRRFFDAQLPRIVDALERIATALEALNAQAAAPREKCPTCGSDEGQFVPPGSGDAHCLRCGAHWPPLDDESSEPTKD